MGFFFGVPRVPRGIASRPRLTERLDLDSALMIVRGGPGTGKTVAVADWATQYAQRPGTLPGLWFTVDSESGSRFALWAALLQQLVDSGLVGGDESIRPLIAAVESAARLRRELARVLSRLRTGVVVVIDNAHLIDDSDAGSLSEDIAAVMQATPKLRIIVIARGELDLERGGFGATLGTDTIAAPELALTVSETAQVMALAGISEGLAVLSAELHAATAGHPLLVRAALIANAKGLVPESLFVGAQMTAAAAIAVRELASSRNWNDRDLDFLMTTAVAEFLSVPLAIELSGRADAEQMLDMAESLGMGLWETDAGSPLFVYTPVMRSELRRDLGTRSPARAAQLHRRAAHWSFENRKAIAALVHAVEAGDIGLAETFLVRDWYEIVRLHPAKVREVLGGLSRVKLSQHPLATMLLAIINNASAVHKLAAVELFALATASAAIKGRSVAPPQRVLLGLVSSVAQRITGQYASALASAKKAIAVMDALTPKERDELAPIKRTLFTQFGLSAHYGGEHHLALDLYAIAGAEADSSTIFGALAGLSLQSGLLADLGRSNEAIPLVERARGAIWPPGWRTGYAGSFFQIAEAYLAIEELDFDRAHAHLDTLEAHMATIEHWATITRVRGMVLACEGRSAEAVALMRAEPLRHSRKLGGMIRVLHDVHLALFELGVGNTRAAEKLLRRHPRVIPLVSMVWALLELTREQPAAALAALDDPDADQSASMHAVGNSLMVRAAALLRLEREADAALVLQEAVALLEVNGCYVIPLMLPRANLDALMGMAERRGLATERAALARSYAQPEYFARTSPSIVLTEREAIVLRELAVSGSNSEIADTLYVSPNTVKSQLRSLYRKLGVSSRTEALLVARTHGLLVD